MPRIPVVAISLLLLLGSLTVLAQEEKSAASKPSASVAELEQQSDKAFEEKNWVRVYVANRKLERLRPWEPKYKINIVRAAGMLDRKNTAYHYMLLMQREGLSYDFNDWSETESLRSTEVYEYVNELMTKAGLPSGKAEVALSVDRSAAGFSAIAWYEAGGQWLLGNASRNELLAVGDDGKASVLMTLPDGSQGVSAMSIGPDGNTLWVSSGDLLRFDLEGKRLDNRIALPGGAAGSLAAAGDGSVYVIDSANATLWKLAPGASELEQIKTGDLLEQPSALALSSDGSQLYVADRALGLVVVDTLAKLAYEMKGPEGLNMGFVTSMVASTDGLLVVQSGFNPDRVMRLTLDAIGMAVESMAPMATAQPQFAGPTGALARGNDLMYLANPGTDDARQNLLVMKTPIDAGDDVAPPDLMQFQEAIRQHQRQQ